MSVPLISFQEFADKVELDDLDGFTRADLERFDYDPPKERVALVAWSEPQSVWRVVLAGDAKRWSELHDWGVLFFGDPPWRRSQCVRVVGRLGSVEAFVSGLAAPGGEFSYVFDAAQSARQAVPVPLAGMPAGRVPASRPNTGAFQRARWKRARRPDGQGELF